MSEILIAAASISNYEGMDVLVGVDDHVYLGKRENYHPCHGMKRHAYYDNSDGSLQLISRNVKMFRFLCGEGWVLSQWEMLQRRAFTKADYMEFASLRSDVLGSYRLIREVTFAGQPFVPPKVSRCQHKSRPCRSR